MKANSNLIMDRLKENVGAGGGCSVVFLKALKSDLNKLLKQYMDVTDIDLAAKEDGDGVDLFVTVRASEFFDIGRGVS
ncbi:MAG: hypothetical protein FWE84_01965 [Firmicutes bacterium]|nr:hypothetical protein [Bacillota bacterium]